MTLDEALERLKKSKFRSKFHLAEKDKEYIAKMMSDGNGPNLFWNGQKSRLLC